MPSTDSSIDSTIQWLHSLGIPSITIKQLQSQINTCTPIQSQIQYLIQCGNHYIQQQQNYQRFSISAASNNQLQPQQPLLSSDDSIHSSYELLSPRSPIFSSSHSQPLGSYSNHNSNHTTSNRNDSIVSHAIPISDIIDDSDADDEHTPLTSRRSSLPHPSIGPSPQRWSILFGRGLRMQQYNVRDEDVVNHMHNSVDSDYNSCGIHKMIFIRIVICFISVLLVWGTSLTASKYITTVFVHNESYNDVIPYWKYIIQVTNQQSDLYAQCVTSSFLHDQLYYNNTLTSLLYQLAIQQEHNQNITDHAVQQSQQCNSNLHIVLQEYNQWLSMGTTIQYNTPQCSNDEIIQVKALIGDYSELLAQQSDGLNNYTNSNNILFDSLQQSLHNYSTYNQQYYNSTVYNITQLIHSINMLSNVSLTPHVQQYINYISNQSQLVTQCMTSEQTNVFCPVSYVQLYDTTALAIFDRTSELLSDFDTLKRIVLTYAAQLDAVYTLLQQAASVSVLINVNITSLLTPFTIPADILPTPFTTLYESLPDFTLPSLDPILARYNHSIKWLQQSMYNDIEAMNQQLYTLTLQLPSLLASYNPPNITIQSNKLSQQYSNISSLYTASINQQFNTVSAKIHSVALNPNNTYYNNMVLNISNHYHQTRTNTTPQSLNDTITTLYHSSVTSDPFSYAFVAFTRPSISIDGILYSLSFISILLGAADIAYRIYRSIDIIHKLIRKPNLLLPPVDVRSMTSRVESITNNIMTILLHPQILIIFVIAVFIWAIVLIVLTYIPIVQQYSINCVQHPYGTLLGNTSYTIIYNTAATAGNMEYAKNKLLYETYKAADCAQYYETSQQLLIQQQEQIKYGMNQQYSNTAKLASINKCVLTQSFDDSILPNTVNTTGLINPFILSTDALNQCDSAGLFVSNNSLSSNDTYQSSYHQSINNYTLINAIFNCSLLPTSINTCAGPNSDILFQAAYDTSCNTEYAVHSTIQVYGVCVLVYILFNVSRSLFMRGICILHWQSLNYQCGFTYISTITDTGTVTQYKPRQLKRMINKHILSYESDSVYYMIGAAITHIPYMIVFMVINNFLNLFGNSYISPPIQQ